MIDYNYRRFFLPLTLTLSLREGREILKPI